MREAEFRRDTAETRVRARVALDGTGRRDCRTGIGFFDTCSTSSRGIR